MPIDLLIILSVRVVSTHFILYLGFYIYSYYIYFPASWIKEWDILKAFVSCQQLWKEFCGLTRGSFISAWRIEWCFAAFF